MSLRKPRLVRSDGLQNFIKTELKQRHISLRKAAASMGIAHSYLSELCAGKKNFSVETCNLIAAYFGQPKIEIYVLAGWLDRNDIEHFLSSVKDKNTPIYGG